MSNVLATKETVITTNEGIKLIRRERTIRMPNGNLRHPVDYYDATPGTVKVTTQELERMRIPVYERIIESPVVDCNEDGYRFIFQYR